MFPLVIYRILRVACWLCAGLQLCCAIDKLKEEQTARINCTRTCAHLTKDLVRTQLSYEISTQQACYKECLRKLGEQGKVEIYGKSHILKRIKRETSQPDPCIKCADASGDIENYRTIPRENISLTLTRLTNGRFYANISWIPPPESVNLKGYTLFYTKGYHHDFCCFLNLTKTTTYAIADNSSYGFVVGSRNVIGVKVIPLPPVDTGDFVDRKNFWIDRIINELTETSQPDPCIKCADASGDIENYRTIPRENISLTLTRLTNGRFYANISWIPPPESVNLKGYMLFYTKGYHHNFCCYLNLTKTTTYAIADNSSYGFVVGSRNVIGVKVIPLPPVDTGDFVDRKNFWIDRIINELTAPATTAITSPSTEPATTAITPPSTDDKTSMRDFIITVTIVVPILAVLALLAYWYFRHPRDRLSKTVLSDTEFQFDAFIIYSSADEEWVKKTLLPILEEKNALKCCIHYRDFVPGKPFRENMADSVYMSRKTIAVVSHNFFKSQYCHHEMDMALGRLVKTGDNSVIVIKLDDVDRKKLPKALKERSYIDYYKLNDKETWEKQLIHCLKLSVKHMITQNSFVKSEMGGVCV